MAVPHRTGAQGRPAQGHDCQDHHGHLDTADGLSRTDRHFQHRRHRRPYSGLSQTRVIVIEMNIVIVQSSEKKSTYHGKL